MQNHDIPLHDIKTIVDVPEYSMYYLSGLIVLGTLLFLGMAYLGYLWFKRKNAFNLKKENLKIIKELDTSDTKKYAYAITHLGAVFKDDSQRHNEMFNNLSSRLESYKYKKSVDSFDDETLGYIELYKEMLDV